MRSRSRFRVGYWLWLAPKGSSGLGLSFRRIRITITTERGNRARPRRGRETGTHPHTRAHTLMCAFARAKILLVEGEDIPTTRAHETYTHAPPQHYPDTQHNNTTPHHAYTTHTHMRLPMQPARKSQAGADGGGGGDDNLLSCTLLSTEPARPGQRVGYTGTNH